MSRANRKVSEPEIVTVKFTHNTIQKSVAEILGEQNAPIDSVFHMMLLLGVTTRAARF